MKESFIAILMGSDSDLPTIQHTLDTLDSLEITWEVKITSAHRTPEDTRRFVKETEQRGCAVFIAAAGLAAHLAGAVAALTIRPVIGIPLDAGTLGGQDALLSTVQMPGGIPVACVAIGKPGAINAGWLAAQILAISDPKLEKRIQQARQLNSNSIRKKNDALQAKLGRA
jgi:5-(carboxyamino)imidazole ribonucleotide mutase